MKLNGLGDCLQSRLRAIRIDQKLSQEEFGAKIGITRSAICNYENGTRPISEQIVLAVCREFGVSETWFRNGVGEMYRNKEDGAIAQLIAEYNCSNFEGDFLKSYFQMDQTERDQFVSAMYRLVAPFFKSLEGKNPFADYYNMSVNSELIYCKSQREQIDSRIKWLEQQNSDSKPIQEGATSSVSKNDEVDVLAELEKLKKQNQELLAQNQEIRTKNEEFQTRLEAIEKEEDLPKEQEKSERVRSRGSH